MAINLSFNGFSLQSSTILTGRIDQDSLPPRALAVSRYVRAAGGRITNDQYNPKEITVEGKIIGNSIANLDSLIDGFKKALYGQLKNLDIDFGGSIRRYRATASNEMITRSDAIFAANFSVTFLVPEGYGFDTAAGTFAPNFSGTTAFIFSSAFTPGGTAQQQAPIITTTINSLAGGNAANVSIINTATSQGITVTRNWSAGDVMVIDCVAMTVTVNGTAVDYSGVFPTWEPVSGNIRYGDTFTSRSAQVSSTYTKRYL